MSAPLRVLLVEDNPGDADLTKETLERGARPLAVVHVGDGAEAVDYLTQRGAHAGAERPDVVLLDLNLPRVSGGEVLAEMRRHESLRRVPVVVFSSSDAERDVARSYELGANCYVTKPVGFAAFRAALRAVEDFWFTVAKLPCG